MQRSTSTHTESPISAILLSQIIFRVASHGGEPPRWIRCQHLPAQRQSRRHLEITVVIFTKIQRLETSIRTTDRMDNVAASLEVTTEGRDVPTGERATDV